MLAYRDDSRRVDARRELARLRRLAGNSCGIDAALSLLIRAGTIEAGLVDAHRPERDGFDGTTAAARAMTVGAARLWLARRHETAGDADAFARAIDTVLARELPADISLRVPEGFAYYAVFPETYAAAADAADAAYGCPHVCVLGLRSIGATLAAVVHAALEARGRAVWSCTVRPRGHPFDRRIVFDAALSARLRAQAERGAIFLIADEGPGLSGSSFASASVALRALGLPADRIVFLPGWDPGAERLRAGAARHAWTTHRRIHVDAAAIGIDPARLFGADGGVDYSAGRWRTALYRSPAEWPPVQPAHERWKLRLPRQDRLVKFVGLGEYGLAARRRAEILASLNLGPTPGALRSGFLDLPFVAGTPWSRADGDPAVVGRYIARVAAAFPADSTVEAGALFEMILTNVRELAGAIPAALPAALENVRPTLAVAPASAIDGRMLPHEWIASPAGPVKVDALDHHRDHFFPGLQHPAWDLAAATVEFGWNAPRVEKLLHTYERYGGDETAGPLLPFYTLAYAAFRAGYLTLAGLPQAAEPYSQCALNAAACFSASSKSPRKHTARSSMKT